MMDLRTTSGGLRPLRHGSAPNSPSRKANTTTDSNRIHAQWLKDQWQHIARMEQLGREHVYNRASLELDHHRRQDHLGRQSLAEKEERIAAERKQVAINLKLLDERAKAKSTLDEAKERRRIPPHRLNEGSRTDEAASPLQRPEWGKRLRPLSPTELRRLDDSTERQESPLDDVRLIPLPVTPASSKSAARREAASGINSSPTITNIVGTSAATSPFTERTAGWSRPWTSNPYDKGTSSDGQATPSSNKKAPYNQFVESTDIAVRLEDMARGAIEHEEEACFNQLQLESKLVDYFGKVATKKLEEQKRIEGQREREHQRVLEKRQLHSQVKRLERKAIALLAQQRSGAASRSLEQRKQRTAAEEALSKERNEREAERRAMIRTLKEAEARREATLRKNDVADFKETMSPHSGSYSVSQLPKDSQAMHAHQIVVIPDKRPPAVDGRPPMSPLREAPRSSKIEPHRSTAGNPRSQRAMSATPAAVPLHRPDAPPTTTLTSHIKVNYSSLAYPAWPRKALAEASATGNKSVIDNVQRLLELQSRAAAEDQRLRTPFLAAHRRHSATLLRRQPLPEM